MRGKWIWNQVEVKVHLHISPANIDQDRSKKGFGSIGEMLWSIETHWVGGQKPTIQWPSNQPTHPWTNHSKWGIYNVMLTSQEGFILVVFLISSDLGSKYCNAYLMGICGKSEIEYSRKYFIHHLQRYLNILNIASNNREVNLKLKPRWRQKKRPNSFAGNHVCRIEHNLTKTAYMKQLMYTVQGEHCREGGGQSGLTYPVPSSN